MRKMMWSPVVAMALLGATTVHANAAPQPLTEQEFACFYAGSPATDANFLSKILDALVGNGGTGLPIDGLEDLLGSDQTLPLGDLLDQLQDVLGLGDDNSTDGGGPLSDLLGENLSGEQLFDALADVLEDAQVPELPELLRQLGDEFSADNLSLEDILDLDGLGLDQLSDLLGGSSDDNGTDDNSTGDLEIDLPSLLTVALSQLAEERGEVDGDGLAVNADPAQLGDSLGDLLAINDVNVEVLVVDGARIACGPVGTTTRGQALRIKVDLDAVADGVDLDAPGLLTAVGDVASLVVYIELFTGDANLTALDVAAGTATTTTQPSLAKIHIGHIDDALFFDPSHEIDPDTDLQHAAVGDLSVELLSLGLVSADILIKTSANATGDGTDEQHFTGPYAQTIQANSPLDLLGTLGSLLVANLDYDIDADLLGIELDVLNDLLDSLTEDLLGPLLIGDGSDPALLPLIDGLSPILDPITEILTRADITLTEMGVAQEGCGDGDIDPDEECDDGNVVDGDGCSATCTESVCGDGVVEGGEACDDGNTEDNDGCDATCAIEPIECGNGRVETGEECDDGNTEAGDGCDAECATEAVCGDGIVHDDEDCDDGNTVSGDGCSDTCVFEPNVCGNGVLEPANDEECDDNNVVDGDGCDSNCKTESTQECGNGVVEGDEVCDDGNTVSGDGCAADCSATEPVCGNGTVESGEACDDGNTVSGDGCAADCSSAEPVCGNNVIETGEVCDDGNEISGDGCSADCKEIEPICGNGTIEAGEACDDGNTADGDGCSAVCMVDQDLSALEGGGCSAAESGGSTGWLALLALLGIVAVRRRRATVSAR